jgi:hypothetical protein
VSRIPEPGLVQELLKKGQLQKAVRRARALGIPLRQDEIDAAAEAMFHDGRAGELLSCVGTLEIRLPYDVPVLLRRALETKDYHAFLKQAHRLRVKAGFEEEIELAIEATQRRAPEEAAGWRRKFGAF